MSTNPILPVLMILTSYRYDSFLVCWRCLEKHSPPSVFKRIYIMANEVAEPHAKFIRMLEKKYPNVKAIHCGPRGLLPCGMDMQNWVMENHYNDVLIKIDEDSFVSKGWLEPLLREYERTKDDENILLLAPFSPVTYKGVELIRPYIDEHFPGEFDKYLPGAHFASNPWAHFVIWELVLKYGLIERMKEFQRERVLRVQKEGFTSCCRVFDRRFIDRIWPINNTKKNPQDWGSQDDFAINHVLLEMYAVYILNSVVHHHSYGNCADRLTKRIPLGDILSHILAE